MFWKNSCVTTLHELCKDSYLRHVSTRRRGRVDLFGGKCWPSLSQQPSKAVGETIM